MIRYKASKQARILFVGINPHHGSDRRGVPFSNNKMFWYLLNRAGLLQESEASLRDDATLKRIYEEKFLPVYRLSLVNLVDRPTRDVSELSRGEEEAGVRRAMRIIRTYHPAVVCFVGKVTYNTFRGSQTCAFGWQEDLHGSKVYVAHFPVRGAASVRIEEFQEIKRVAFADAGAA